MASNLTVGTIKASSIQQSTGQQQGGGSSSAGGYFYPLISIKLL